MFLDEFGQGLGGGFVGSLQRFDGGLFGGEVAGHDQRRRDQVHLVLGAAEGEIGHLLDLLVLVLDDGAGAGGVDPAVGGDHVDVVLHHLVPVVHQPLVDVVAVEQGHVGEARQQVFGQGVDHVLGLAAGAQILEVGSVRLSPAIEDRGHPARIGFELGVFEDGLFDGQLTIDN